MSPVTLIPDCFQYMLNLLHYHYHLYLLNSKLPPLLMLLKFNFPTHTYWISILIAIRIEYPQSQERKNP